MPLAALALMLASGVNSLVEGGAVDAFLRQVYAPYHADPSAAPAPLDRAIWSSRAQALLRAWKAGGEHKRKDAALRHDMLCDCDDWSASDFRVEVMARQFSGPERAVLLLNVWPDGRHVRQVRLALVKEQTRWLIDELGDPGGRNLSGQLRSAIGHGP